ncbi:MAG: betaine--homocysteine S-methyltransferase [Dongiaceae bacterium]
MSDRLARLLAERPFLLADGATGTNLFDAGLQSGDAPEMWNFEHPDRIERLHLDMIAAGADIILTNSFGGTRYRLKLHRAEDRVAEINREAARLARRVADDESIKRGRSIVVAGSMGPSGELFEPLGPLTIAEGAAAFAEQAQALIAGGADLLWVETMSSKDELQAAVEGAASTGEPIVCTMSFDTNGRTMMGITPGQVAQLCHGLHPRPIAFGANCGIGAAELVATLVNMAPGRAPDDILVAKGNCGVPYYEAGKIKYDGTPELMADYARMARDAGARIIGGCCGTTPGHLSAMRAALDGYSPKAAPSIDEISQRLGRLSAGAAQLSSGDTAEGESVRRRSRRRRGEDAAAEPAA